MAQTPSFRQLCMIARSTMASSEDDSTWSEAIKTRVARMGFEWPARPDAITKAIRAVEHVHGRRPATSGPPKWNVDAGTSRRL
jgi:hypothetical protein